mgnify:CR=1 FL=1
MSKVKFGDIVKDVKINVDRDNNPYEFYVAGDHMDSEDLNIRRRGRFATDDVGPAFTRIFKKGQVLYGSRRTYLKKVAVADFDGICANTTFVFESKDPAAFEQRLLPFLMLSEGFTNWSIAHSKGSTNPYVLFSDLASYEFDLPSLAEQKVLAEKLWAAYEVKQSYLKMIEATQEMVKSQFIEMFGGGNWPQKTLGEVGSFTRGGGFQKSDFVEHGIPCIHYGQIHTKFGPFITSHITEISSDLESKTKFASKGDLVIAITSEDTEGSCKSTAWLGDYSVAVGGHAAIYKHSMNPLYMSFFFKSTLFNHAKIEYVHGTKVFEIKPDDIAKILVPYPPMSLQNQFSAIAEQADKSVFELRKSVDAIDKVIKSLINENL